MHYVECPEIYPLLDNQRGLFLAGGITGCPDWQSEIVVLLRDTNWVVFNPRRKNFPIDDPHAVTEQIKWEYDHLRKASTILFWFPCETICPIALYELGAWLMTEKPIYIGVHPEYERRKDIEVQTGLVRPNVAIVYSLEDLGTLAKA